MIVDRAIYVDGKRAELSGAAEDTYAACRRRGGMAWIGLYEPDEAEFSSVAEEFGLHPLAVEDAVHAHQRPKLEKYGDTYFVVLKTARYVDETETVEFGEIHVFVGEDFVVTVRHGEASALRGVRERLEGDRELLRRGPASILYAIMDRVVDDYGPVVDGLENDIDEIESEVFGGSPHVSRRIYELSREVVEFHRATRPLAGVLERMLSDGGPPLDVELKRYMRDVHDHAIRTNEQIEGFRELISNILNVNLTLVSVEQNDEVKRISAWAAILFAPTVIAGIYGMNFDRMPELHWDFGYPFALALMLGVSGVLYALFRRRGWL
ncbi:magnesium and cobalt transport protein CorA [Rubrobacter xylanophilus DSM 9941]|uniref:Magnesium transport protein CorA n=1 Tax=Rubrobacter xylanophilus (strain DSM 9941 / JCM 11954 / NBRC 16129 / PRD-1) TaxID=266117 RepID=Q1AZZ0_RUBXD|nr:magnesium and cobalt transport protein CorA [Rubrobacter xylanophilus DSM 9941]